jgi:hypothetical protein
LVDYGAVPALPPARFHQPFQAQAALHSYEERSRQDLRNLINIVRKWAERKEGHALDWLTAL